MKRDFTDMEVLLGYFMALAFIGLGLFQAGIILPAIIVSAVAVAVASRIFRKGQGAEVVRSVRGGCMGAIGLVFLFIVISTLISIFF